MSSDAILQFLNAHKGARIALVGHVRPDGDAIGAAVGLSLLLSANGWPATPVNFEQLPKKYLFLVDSSPLVYSSPDWYHQYDCIGVLDCGSPDRLSPINRPAVSALPAFTIDHHESSQGFGQARWILPDASSTGEMVVRLAKQAGWQLTPAAAQALWASIITDCGKFCYENATPEALRSALACLEAGARPAPIADHVFTSTVGERRLHAIALERMEVSEHGKLAMSWIEQNDYKRAGCDKTGVSEIISLLRDMQDVQCAVFFYESDGNIKVSMRTKPPYNALDVVTQFGGGGHIRAAGCTLYMPFAQARDVVLNAIRSKYFNNQSK